MREEYSYDDQRLLESIRNWMRSITFADSDNSIKYRISLIQKEINKVQNYGLRRSLQNELDALEKSLERHQTERSERYEQHSKKLKEERRDLVTSYRNAWKKRNFVWKMFHQKYNPYKKNLDSYSDVRIESLVDKVKGK